jgi:hypothetical protein
MLIGAIFRRVDHVVWLLRLFRFRFRSEVDFRVVQSQFFGVHWKNKVLVMGLYFREGTNPILSEK